MKMESGTYAPESGTRKFMSSEAEDRCWVCGQTIVHPPKEERMYWEVEITIDTGGKYPAVVEEVRTVTKNNQGIFKALDVLPEGREELTCSEWLPLVESAITKLEDPDESLRALEPIEERGGLSDSRNFLLKLKGACGRHLKAKVRWK
jgi:hypothetical protein